MADDPSTSPDPVDKRFDKLDEFDEAAWQLAEEEAFADRRTSAIEAGRRKGGVMGAAMAGAMLAIQEIYEGPKKDEMVAVSESPDEPGDIDKDGIIVNVGDVDVEAKLPENDEG